MYFHGALFIVVVGFCPDGIVGALTPGGCRCARSPPTLGRAAPPAVSAHPSPLPEGWLA